MSAAIPDMNFLSIFLGSTTGMIRSACNILVLGGWSLLWKKKRVMLLQVFGWEAEMVIILDSLNLQCQSPFSVLKKLRGLSPRANYSDRAAAAGRRS